MIHDFEEHSPQIDGTAFVHPDATVIGACTIGARSSIWPATVLRADMGRIVIGDDTSVQDGSSLHLTEGVSETIVGDRVTVGHKAILHGCIVEDECLIGMGAVVLDNARIGAGSLVAAGSLITYNTVIPPGSVVMGSPAKVVREVRERDVKMIDNGWRTYSSYAERFRKQLS